MPRWNQLLNTVFPPIEAIGEGGESTPTRVWAWAALAAATSFLICMTLANRRGLWLDEYFTLRAVRLDPAAMVAERIAAGHSPVYFFYAKLWHWLGESVFALRFTSALMAAANILLLTGLALQMRLRRALPSLWLVALGLPYWISIGTEYRYMMFATAAASGVLWLTLRYAERPDRQRGAALAAAIAMLAWIHASIHLLILLILLFLAIDLLRSRRSIVWVWPVIIGWSTSIPLLMRIAGHKSVSRTNLPGLCETLLNLFETTLGDITNTAHRLEQYQALVFYPAAAIVMLSLAGAMRALPGSGRRREWLLLATLLVGMPAFFLVFCFAVRNHQGPVRYLATFSIPCALCIGIYLHALWRQAPTRPVALGFGAILLVQGAIIGFSHGEMLRESIRWIVLQRRPSDVVILSRHELPALLFQQEGAPDPNDFIGVARRHADRAKLAAEINRRPADSRGFVLLYTNNEAVRKFLKEMRRKGVILEYRERRVSPSVTLLAWIRSPADRHWLKEVDWP